MQTLWQDLRYGARMLLKQPGFTLVAILTLALGIGANTAIFSVVNAALLRSLPYDQAEQLVAVFVRTQKDPREYVAWPDLLDWRAQNQSFAQLAAFVPQSVNLTARSGSQVEPGRVIGGFVSADFFPMLKVAAAQGRAFLPGEDSVGAAPVAVISYETWRDRFGADPHLLGQTLAPGFVSILRILVAQGLLDFQRQGVLAFQFVGVVRVHGAQQHTKVGQCARLAHAGQLPGGAHQVVCLLQQGLQTVRVRKQRLHL